MIYTHSDTRLINTHKPPSVLVGKEAGQFGGEKRYDTMLMLVTIDQSLTEYT